MTLNDLFEDTLLKLVDVQIERLTDHILTKAAVTSMDQYTYLLGQIDALRRMLPDLCAEANKLIAENHR